MAEDGISRRDFFLGRFTTRHHANERARVARQEESRSPRRSFPLHRPPGALAEDDFLAACTRCGDCATACPHGAIQPAPARLRVAEGTPVIQPMLAPCRMCVDLPCVSACEPRALRREQPARMAEARVEIWACLAYTGSFCTVCSEQCPVPGAIRLTAGKPTVVQELCTGCGVCQHVCPAPANAILIMPLAARATTQPAETNPHTSQ